MTFVLLALMLGASPDLWVATQGFDLPACSSEALALALHTQRPGVVVHLWHPEAGEQPPAGALRVRLSPGEGVTLLEIDQAGDPVTRPLSAADGCERTVELAALIVDGALDELRGSEPTPQVDSLAPPIPLRKQIQIGATVGAGLLQGPIGFGAGFDAQGVARLQGFELTLDIDVGLPASTPFTVPPSTEAGGSGVLSVTFVDAELGLGIAPRLGPGRLTGDVLVGLSLAFASVGEPAAGLFQQSNQTATELFLGLRLGYLFDLPFGFFAGARVEERIAPDHAAFTVDGATSDFNVSTRTWTFQALGLVGYRFL